MIGRSLLPFGDTFAVLMVVFLVLSLSVGRFSSGPEGSSVREPMMIAIGTPDPFGTQAEGFVAFSSNVTSAQYRHTAPERNGNVMRMIAFLQGVLQDVEILAQAPIFALDSPDRTRAPIPTGTPQLRDWVESLDDEFPGMFGWFRAARFPIDDTGELDLPSLPIVDENLYALTDSCRPLEDIVDDPILSTSVNLVASGFDEPTSNSVSLALGAVRGRDVLISGLFSAPPTPADPDLIVEYASFHQALCRGYAGAADDGGNKGSFNQSTPCNYFSSSLEFTLQLRESAERFSEARRTGSDTSLTVVAPTDVALTDILRFPFVLVRPRDSEDRRRLGELIYHSVVPKPVEILVFETDGSERRFRTPTWREMFSSGRGVAPNDAWTSDALCRANAAAFMSGQADDVAHLFSFRMTVGRNGDIDHHGTLIEIPVRGEP